MARVTVEDCLEHLENQFQVALVAAKRARQLARGAEAQVPWANDKPTVVALREIADGHISAQVLEEDDLPMMPQIRAELAAIEPGPDA